VNQIACISTIITALAVASGWTSGNPSVMIGVQSATYLVLPHTKVKMWGRPRSDPVALVADLLTLIPTTAAGDAMDERSLGASRKGEMQNCLVVNRPSSCLFVLLGRLRTLSALLRFFFLASCRRGLSRHVSWIVMERSRLLFSRLLLIWILIVGHGMLLFIALLPRYPTSE
jgi:hypothetical protein